jgi:hypothetical protein
MVGTAKRQFLYNAPVTNFGIGVSPMDWANTKQARKAKKRPRHPGGGTRGRRIMGGVRPHSDYASPVCRSSGRAFGRSRDSSSANDSECQGKGYRLFVNGHQTPVAKSAAMATPSRGAEPSAFPLSFGRRRHLGHVHSLIHLLPPRSA